jgi:hypothetical protein
MYGSLYLTAQTFGPETLLSFPILPMHPGETIAKLAEVDTVGG